MLDRVLAHLFKDMPFPKQHKDRTIENGGEDSVLTSLWPFVPISVFTEVEKVMHSGASNTAMLRQEVLKSGCPIWWLQQ